MVSNCELPPSTVYQSVCAAGRNTALWAYFSCNTAFDICAFHLGACSCQYTFQKVDPKSVLFFFFFLTGKALGGAKQSVTDSKETPACQVEK